MAEYDTEYNDEDIYNGPGMEASINEIIKAYTGKNNLTDSINALFKRLAIGSNKDAIANNFYGLNHRQKPSMIPMNRDRFGFTFFTRPRLNLTTDNVRAERQLGELLTNESMSIQRAIRCTLDPLLAKGDSGITSPLIDPNQVFIPLLTNQLISIGGWPDLEAMTYTSPEGIARESFSYVDGIFQDYRTFDITANFRNIEGDPITLLLLTWLFYMSYVYLGSMVPYHDAIINNEIDYNTRIYRFSMDKNNQTIQKWSACGAAFPLTVPIGAAFNYESDRPINSSNDQLTTRFRCMGVMYNDTILLDEFNRAVTLFNTQFTDENRSAMFQKIPYHALDIFNNQGYPYINVNTKEIEWWVTKEDYTKYTSLVTTDVTERGSLING